MKTFDIFNDIFEAAWSPLGQLQAAESYKATHYSVTPGETWKLCVDLPGYSSEDVDVSVFDTGNHGIKVTTKDNKYSQLFAVGKLYDLSTAAASMKNGRLEVEVSRAQNTLPRRLSISNK